MNVSFYIKRKFKSFLQYHFSLYVENSIQSMGTYLLIKQNQSSKFPKNVYVNFKAQQNNDERIKELHSFQKNLEDFSVNQTLLNTIVYLCYQIVRHSH